MYLFTQSLSRTLRLTEVLNPFQTAGLKLKPCKCHFYCEQVQFLGHVISGNGVATDPEKIELVQKKKIQDHHQLQVFLGIVFSLQAHHQRLLKNCYSLVKAD